MLLQEIRAEKSQGPVPGMLPHESSPLPRSPPTWATVPEQQIYRTWCPAEKQLPINELPRHSVRKTGQGGKEATPLKYKDAWLSAQYLLKIPSLRGAQALVRRSEAKWAQRPSHAFNF